MKFKELTELLGKEIISERDRKYQEFTKAWGEAVLKYCKDGVGTIYIDDIRFDLYTDNKWVKVSFHFKVADKKD